MLKALLRYLALGALYLILLAAISIAYATSQFISSPIRTLSIPGFYWFFVGLSCLFAGLIGLSHRRQALVEQQNENLTAILKEKQDAEEKLAMEEHRFQSMFDTSPDPTWIIDGHRFTLCNQAAVEILGYNSKEDLGDTHPSKLSPEFQPDGESSFSKAERMMRIADERGLHRFEWMHTRRNGTDFPAEVTLSRMTLKGKQVIYCVWRDISERKAAEEKDREMQQLVHAIIEQASALVYVFNVAGELILCNREFEKAVGHERELILGKTRFHFMPPEIAQQNFNNDTLVLASGKSLSLEESNQGNDGEHCYLTVKSPLYTSTGIARAVVGISTDITQRKRTENERRLAASVFDHTADGIIITDEHATIVSVNRAFSQITGYASEDVVGKNPRFLKSPRHDARFYHAMWETIDREGCWQGEIWDLQKNGESIPLWQTITSVQGANGKVSNFVSVFSDISIIKRSQIELEYLAHFDSLTKLPNRTLFRDRATNAFGQTKRHDQKLAILLLDLDGFKNVNDSLGHPAGDRLLQLVATRLKNCVREEDTIARLGGDEFGILLSNLAAGEDAAQVALKLLHASQQAYIVDEHSVMVTASIGIAIFPDDGKDANDLIRYADAAMYESKKNGRNTYRFYQLEMTHEAQRKLTFERGLRRAIDNKEFEVWYQPQICLLTGKYLGAEALLRWRDPIMGLIQPLDFVPLAEANGMILPIGEIVLEQVCIDVRAALNAGRYTGRLSFNVAGPQLYRSDFVKTIERLMQTYEIPHGALEIEVTETFMMDKPEEIRSILREIQKLGVTTAIDDFGTGYSSLAYLRDLPIDTLKIDRAFIRDLPENEKETAIVRAILALGNSMGFHVIAEGIETEAQRAFLQAEGCREGQGFLFAKPMPYAEFTKWLAAQAS